MYSDRTGEVVLRAAHHRHPVLTYRVALFFLAVVSSVTEISAERLPIKNYTTADGLPRDYVNKIVQDSRGFLWFCTNEGLSRFDGYKFTNYGTADGLAGRAVNGFLETRSGAYWVATEKGVCQFLPDASSTPAADKPLRFAPYYPGEGIQKRLINSIYEDRAGNFWCATDAGLYRVDATNPEPVFSFEVPNPDPEGKGFGRVDSMVEDRGGALWILSQTGLYRRRPTGVYDRFAADEGLPEQDSTCLLADGQGRIWIGSFSGVCLLVPDPTPHMPVIARRFIEADGLNCGNVTALLASVDGRIWVGGDRGLSVASLAQLHSGLEFKTYTQDDGLSTNTITALAQDRDRNVWIAGASKGVMRLAPYGFTTFNKTDGMAGTRVASIFEDRAGQLCVTTSDQSISVWDRGRFKSSRLVLPKSVRGWTWGWYQTTFQDREGEWWMATGDGLVRYPRLKDEAELERAAPKAIYKIGDGLPGNQIFRLFEDSRGDIWIGTIDTAITTLTRWERASETFHQFPDVYRITQSVPTAFCEIGADDLWIGFYHGTIARYKGGHFAFFSQADGIGAGLIRGMYLDHFGRLWIATDEGGLTRVDNPQADRPVFVTYSAADGLSSNQANCVTEDEWGMIYVGTARGVDELNPETNRIRHFTTADGLTSSFVNVAHRSKDGSLWFGTFDGLSRFTPHQESGRPASPIVITRLEIAGVPYPIGELGAARVKTTELGPAQNHLQIEFAGLSLAAGESLSYQYRLEGASSEWSAPTDRRVVNYPNLPPGSYRFLVQAVNSSGIQSVSPAMISFTISPPIWQRWWFRLLALVLVGLPIFAVLRYRYQKMKAIRDAETALRKNREERLVELERVRKRIATDLHDDIGSSVSLIHFYSEVVRRRIDSKDREIAEPLEMISSSSQELLGSMSDIVWAINPQRDHLSDLIQRMRRLASDAFAATGIEFRFQASGNEADVRLGADVRREVFLIFKESVNNLVKHSGCTSADIEFDLLDDLLRLTVKDNGRGFDARAESEGQGLSSITERAKSLGGQIEITSAPGEGTTVILCLTVDHKPS